MSALTAAITNHHHALPTHRSSHLYEYTIRFGDDKGAAAATPSVEGRRLIRQETDARNWEFPQVRVIMKKRRMKGCDGARHLLVISKPIDRTVAANIKGSHLSLPPSPIQHPNILNNRPLPHTTDAPATGGAARAVRVRHGLQPAGGRGEFD
jgi:hypothetical protein